MFIPTSCFSIIGTNFKGTSLAEIARIQIYTATHGRKRFPGGVVTTQNARKSGRKQEVETFLLPLLQQKSRNKNIKKINIDIKVGVLKYDART